MDKKERHRRAQLAYRQRHPDRRKKSYTLHNWRKKGILCDDWEGLYEQYTSTTHCQICHTLFYSDGHNSRKCLDHDHDTGRVRGIICEGCNMVLRHYASEERLKALIKYLTDR